MNGNTLQCQIKVEFSSSKKACCGFVAINNWLKKALRGTLLESEGENGNYTTGGGKYLNGSSSLSLILESNTNKNILWQTENIIKFINSLRGVNEVVTKLK